MTRQATRMNESVPFASRDSLVSYMLERLDPQSVKLTSAGDVVMRDTKVGVDCRSAKARRRSS